MIFKVRIGSWRITFTIAPVTDVTGVNSTLKDGNHIIMWDFDKIPLSLVTVALEIAQYEHDLPNIYILNTGKPNHYIAYCFTRCMWRHSVEIVASTPFVDPNFFKYGVYREHWTLRVTPKEGRKPKLVKILPSPIPEGVNISELNSWVKDTLTVRGSALSFLTHCPALPSASQLFTPPKGEVSAQNTRHSQTLRQ